VGLEIKNKKSARGAATIWTKFTNLRGHFLFRIKTTKQEMKNHRGVPHDVIDAIAGTTQPALSAQISGKTLQQNLPTYQITHLPIGSN
jgi:hypothetical protein